MKKHLLLITFLLQTAIVLAQIPNSGMELWSGAPQLLGWQTNSYPMTLPPYDPYIVRQDTNRHSGAYAALFWGNGVMKPYATTTFALAQHPTSLSLWYRTAFPPCVNDLGFPDADTVTVKVELLLGNTTVDQGFWSSTLPQWDYALLTIPFPQNASVFDSCRISIWGGKVYGGCGFAPASTEFWVDELTLDFPQTSCVDSTQIDSTVMCLGVVLPVCGCNGVTYNNSCEAENYGGVSTWTDGVCGSSGGGTCHADFTYTKQPNAISFTNTSSAASFTSYLWTFGDGNSSTFFNAQHTYQQPGWYVACLSIAGTDSTGNACTDEFCDSIYVTDGCVDSSQICPPTGLCCDAPLEDPVCGCNGVDYTNACVATYFGGVLSFTQGPCIIMPGMRESQAGWKINISPNPAQDELTLVVDSKETFGMELMIRNLQGEILQKETLHYTGNTEQKLTVGVSHLAKGFYLLSVKTLGKGEWVKKLLIN